MNYLRHSLIGKVHRLRAALLPVIAVGIAAPCLYGQVSPVNDSQTSVLSNLDQSTMYPIQTEMAETSNLNRLNENADTSRYTDNPFRHGPFYFSVEALGVWTTNLQNAYSNEPYSSGEYFRLGAPVGLHLTNERTDFNGFFRVDSSMYPGYNNLTHTSEVYSHQLVHQFSDITTSSWSLAGGHIETLGQYLSPVVTVGSAGVVAPQQTSGLQSTDDAATTYTLAHQMSERDTLTASGTAGWLDQPVVNASGARLTTYREITGGGAAQWQHALNTRETVGAEVTNVYVHGLTPTGDSNFTAAKFTFSQTLTPHSFVSGGVGPLYAHSAVTGTTTQSYVSYAANVDYTNQTRFGRISGGYSRLYAVGYLAPASVGNYLYLNFDRPLSPMFHLTADTLYLRTALPEQQTSGVYSQVGFTTRLDVHLTRYLEYQIEGDVFNQDATSLLPGYSYDNVATGFTFYFGNIETAEGVQP